jgi:hypothetical protein
MRHRLALVLISLGVSQAAAREPIPDRLVVLTFDDSVKSQYSVVRPILKKYGFGATFFVTEGFDFATNKQDYMTWEEIAALNADGFEIGNHTRDHVGFKPGSANQFAEQVRAIAQRCHEHKIPAPISFAWPALTNPRWTIRSWSRQPATPGQIGQSTTSSPPSNGLGTDASPCFSFTECPTVHTPG